MKVLGILLFLFVFLFCIFSDSFANGAVKGVRAPGQDLSGEPIVGSAAVLTERSRLKSPDPSCRVVYKGQKPFSAMLEDFVAYALDIPLAMLTPFVTAITPIMDKLDYGCDNGYPRGPRK